MKLGLSERTFFGVLKYVNNAPGKPSIEVGIQFALYDRKSMLADLLVLG